MNVVFPPKDERYIKAMVEDGFYHNATELVRDAVRRLREQEEAKYLRLKNALDVGEKAYHQGEYEFYSSELLKKISAEAVQHAKNGGAVDPDVCG